MSNHIYILRFSNNSNLFKVGKSKNISKRIGEDKTFNPFLYPFVILNLPNNRMSLTAAEKLAHRQIESQRLEGEWFVLSVEMLVHLINTLRSEGFSISRWSGEGPNDLIDSDELHPKGLSISIDKATDEFEKAFGKVEILKKA